MIEPGKTYLSAHEKAEEKRIREIDEIACLFDSETVQAAKYGPNACTAQEMAYRAALEANRRGITAKEAEARAAVKVLLYSTGRDRRR